MGVLYEEDSNWKKSKSGQIPAFGNWDYANDLPITQYFESARQAGLIRVSHSSAADSGEYCDARYQHHYTLRCSDYRPPPPKNKVQLAKEHRRRSLKENKVDYLTEQPRQNKLTSKDNRRGGATHVQPGKQKQNQKTTDIINVRAVDEDLYKIPPELLHSSKRKKRLGFFSCCSVPACMV